MVDKTFWPKAEVYLRRKLQCKSSVVIHAGSCHVGYLLIKDKRCYKIRDSRSLSDRYRADVNTQFVNAIFGLRRLRPFLVGTGFTAATIDAVVTATYDRAILLTEVTRVVMTHHLKVPDGELDIISRPGGHPHRI